MKCIDPKIEKLVSLYQFNMLGPDEKLAVEDHLLECDACFEEVYRLSSAVGMVQEQPEIFLDALEPKKTCAMRMTSQFKKIINELSKLKKRLLVPMANWWRLPAIRILIPVTVVTILILAFLTPLKNNFSDLARLESDDNAQTVGSMLEEFPMTPLQKSFSDLAIIENASYIALKVRGFADKFSSTQHLYDQGMKNYQEKNYEQAIQKLSAFVKHKKDNAYGHFYLGVSYLLTDNYKKGIKHLESASELCQKQNKELLLGQCYWQLGNAYLKINEVDKAVKELRNIIVMGGEYKDDALNQITKIEELKAE